MSSFEKKVIKSKLDTKLRDLGFSVSTTDTSKIAVFTDKPINENSVKIGNYTHSYITSFTPKSALTFIYENWPLKIPANPVGSYGVGWSQMETTA